LFVSKAAAQTYYLAYQQISNATPYLIFFISIFAMHTLSFFISKSAMHTKYFLLALQTLLEKLASSTN
jgi:hypothetical protein